MKYSFEKLAYSSQESQSSEHLKLLAKRAAASFASGSSPNLNDAIKSVVDGESLNPNQVARIVETANQETWKTLFHEQRNPNVDFLPGNLEDVIGAFSSKPEVTTNQPTDLDFLSDVPNQRLSDHDLAEVFGIKKDTADYETLNPHREEGLEVDKIASARDLAVYGTDIAASNLAEAGEVFYGLFKQAHLTDGHGILQMSKLVGEVLEDSTYATDLMQQVANRLVGEGVPFNRRLELEKVSHVNVVNWEHPLLQSAIRLESISRDFYSADSTMHKLAASHKNAAKAYRSKGYK